MYKIFETQLILNLVAWPTSTVCTAPRGQMDHGVCSPVVTCSDHGVGSRHTSVCQRGRLETALGRDAQSARLLQLSNGIRPRGWARDIRLQPPAGQGGPAAPWQGSCVHGGRWRELLSRSVAHQPATPGRHLRRHVAIIFGTNWLAPDIALHAYHDAQNSTLLVLVRTDVPPWCTRHS